MVGCGIKRDSLSIVSVNKVDMGKMSGSQAQINFDLTVLNTSSKKVVIRAIDLTVVDKDNLAVMHIAVNDPIRIIQDTQTDVSLPVTVKFQGLLGLLGIGAKLQNIDKLFVTGTVRYRVGLFSGTYKVKKTSLKKLIGKDGENILQKISI